MAFLGDSFSFSADAHCPGTPCKFSPRLYGFPIIGTPKMGNVAHRCLNVLPDYPSRLSKNTWTWWHIQGGVEFTRRRPPIPHVFARHADSWHEMPEFRCADPNAF